MKIDDKVRLNPKKGYSRKQCSYVYKIIEIHKDTITVSIDNGSCLTKKKDHFIKALGLI